MRRPLIGLSLYGLIILGGSALGQDKPPLTARDYFNELKAANNFIHYKDVYVCFKDNDVPSFVVIARGSDIIEEMKKEGKAPDSALLKVAKVLFVEGYYKGVVTQKAEMYDPVGTDGTDWAKEFHKPFHVRMLYSINWVTGRYREQVYDLTTSKDIVAAEDSGKCELIHPPK